MQVERYLSRQIPRSELVSHQSKVDAALADREYASILKSKLPADVERVEPVRELKPIVHYPPSEVMSLRQKQMRGAVYGKQVGELHKPKVGLKNREQILQRLVPTDPFESRNKSRLIKANLPSEPQRRNRYLDDTLKGPRKLQPMNDYQSLQYTEGTRDSAMSMYNSPQRKRYSSISELRNSPTIPHKPYEHSQSVPEIMVIEQPIKE